MNFSPFSSSDISTWHERIGDLNQGANFLARLPPNAWDMEPMCAWPKSFVKRIAREHGEAARKTWVEPIAWDVGDPHARHPHLWVIAFFLLL